MKLNTMHLHCWTTLGMVSLLAACGGMDPTGTGSSTSNNSPTQSQTGSQTTPDTTTPGTTPTPTPEPTGTTTTTPPSTSEGGSNFTLNFTGTQFTPHVGKNLYVGAVDANGNIVAGIGHAVISSTGTATINLPKILDPNHAYTLAYFADVNSNGACDTTDHQYSEKLPAVTADANVAGTHNTTMTQICAMLPTGTLP